MIGLDEGSRRVGEFCSASTRPSGVHRETLFDEKIGGTVHIALGESFPESGGVNKSALHWDMVCDLRAGRGLRRRRACLPGRPLPPDGRP
jgi:aminopeptidase